MKQLSNIIQIVGACLCLFSSASTLASEPNETPSLPCTTTQAFGQEYGSKKLRGFIRFRLGSALVQPLKEHAPFKEVEVGQTKKTKRVWGAVGTATFSDRAAAEPSISELVKRLESAMTITEKVVDSHANKVTLYTGLEKKCLDSKFAETTCYHSDGASFEFTYAEEAIEPHTVILICSDIAMQGPMIAEALGKD